MGREFHEVEERETSISIFSVTQTLSTPHRRERASAEAGRQAGKGKSVWGWGGGLCSWQADRSLHVKINQTKMKHYKAEALFQGRVSKAFCFPTFV